MTLNDWAVPLAVAVIGATATVVTAYWGMLRERRNVRANLLKDIEIAEKLNEGVAKKALLDYIEDRAFDLTIENDLARFKRREFGDYALIIAMCASLFIAAVTDTSWWKLFFAVITAQLLILIGVVAYRRGLNRLKSQVIGDALKRYQVSEDGSE